MRWLIFPCRPGGKEPLTVHGVKDANDHPEVIRSWSARWPGCNWALATGTPGPDVLDFDVKNGAPGMVTYDRLRRAGMLAGAWAVAETPSGGLHLYFAGTEQGNGSLRGYGLDFRSAGGYVLLPGSVVDGRPYRWLDARQPTGITVDFAAIREYLVPPKLARPYRTGRVNGSVGALVRHVREQTRGNRNTGLFWAACRAVEQGAGEDEFAALEAAGIDVGLTLTEVRATLRSARGRT